MKAPAQSTNLDTARVIMEEDNGFSNLFYIMLILGIIGVIGFLVVAAGAASGSM